MNPDPDYSAAYVVVAPTRGSPGTGSPSPSAAATRSSARRSSRSPQGCRAATSTPCSATSAPSAATSPRLAVPLARTGEGRDPHGGGGHPQRPLGPAARRAGKPLWQLLAALSPEDLVDLVDFRYLDDALTRVRRTDHPYRRRRRPGAAPRAPRRGYPAYATSPGWLGYSDDKMVGLTSEAIAAGYEQIKLKVGADVAADVRRFALAHEGDRAGGGTGGRRQPDVERR